MAVVVTLSNDPTVQNLSRELGELARDIQTLQLIGRDQDEQHREQNRFLTQRRRKVRTILHNFNSVLDPKLPLPRSERIERSRLYIMAVLFQFDMEVFFIRWMAAKDWFEEMGARASPRRSIHGALAILERDIHKRGVKLAAPAYHAIATDLRAWADKLSPEATTASGWLSAAPDVSRDLRLRYHHFYTRELWALVGNPEFQRGTTFSGLRLLARASLRSLYGAVSGYGLHVRRFVATVLLLLFAFGGLYWVIDAASGCQQGTLGGWNVVDHLLLSLAVFTTLGNVTGPVCTADGAAIQRVASVESLTGYIMLGILISVFWMAFHESGTGISNIRLPQSLPAPSLPSASQERAD